jgi:hypothetical protein
MSKIAILRKPSYSLTSQIACEPHIPVNRADATKDLLLSGDRIQAWSRIRYALIDIATNGCERKNGPGVFDLTSESQPEVLAGMMVGLPAYCQKLKP